MGALTYNTYNGLLKIIFMWVFEYKIEWSLYEDSLPSTNISLNLYVTFIIKTRKVSYLKF